MVGGSNIYWFSSAAFLSASPSARVRSNNVIDAGDDGGGEGDDDKLGGRVDPLDTTGTGSVSGIMVCGIDKLGGKVDTLLTAGTGSVSGMMVDGKDGGIMVGGNDGEDIDGGPISTSDGTAGED